MFTPDEGFALVLKYYDIKIERIEVSKNNVTVKTLLVLMLNWMIFYKGVISE